MASSGSPMLHKNMFDWDDLRHFLAVLRCGSTSAAAKALKVNQTTVARRVSNLEKQLGVQLFERRTDGYRATEPGLALLARVERIETETKAIADSAATWQRDARGTIRLTTTESLATDIVAPLLAALREQYPALTVELIADDARLDILNGEADVAIRVGATAEEASLVRRRLPNSAWAVFCSRDYAAKNGVPREVSQLNSHRIIGPAGKLMKTASLTWLTEVAPRAEIAVRCNSVPNLIAAVRAGLGVAPLPCLAATDGSGLVRCLPPEHDLISEIWLIYHESQRGSAPLRVLVDAIVRTFERERGRLEGRRAEAL